MDDAPGPSSIPQAWARPPTGAEQMWVGRGMGVWVEATSKQHHCDPEPLLDKNNAGFPRIPRLLRKQRLDNPGVKGLEGGGEREISRGAGIPSRCWGGVGRGGLPLES